MPLELVSAKIPKEWLDSIEELAAAQRISKSDVLKAAIAAYLGIKSESESPTAMSLILERLDNLESQLTALTLANRQNSPTGQPEGNQSVNAEISNKDKTLAGRKLTRLTGHSSGGKFLVTSAAFDLAQSRGYKNLLDHFRQKGRETKESLQKYGLRRLDDKERESFGKLKAHTTPSYEDLWA